LGDSALQRIDWPLVERANEILGPVNRGGSLTPEDALFIYTNSRQLAESVTSLLEANRAYRELLKAQCPSQMTDGALRSNMDLILSWAMKANEITRFLVDKLKKR
jgi:hypothetical protein